MSSSEDENGSREDKKNAKSQQPDQQTDKGSAGGGADSVQPSTNNLISPVFADKGTAKSIEEGEPLAQVLPFETQVQGHIGRQLRALYDDVLSQPVPERFLELLRALDEEPEPPADPKGET
jgi:hypothetical protein